MLLLCVFIQSVNVICVRVFVISTPMNAIPSSLIPFYWRVRKRQCTSYERKSTEHILITCSDFMETRESHFTAPSLRTLFQEMELQQIFNFQKEINTFNTV